MNFLLAYFSVSLCSSVHLIFFLLGIWFLCEPCLFAANVWISLSSLFYAGKRERFHRMEYKIGIKMAKREIATTTTTKKILELNRK